MPMRSEQMREEIEQRGRCFVDAILDFLEEFPQGRVVVRRRLASTDGRYVRFMESGDILLVKKDVDDFTADPNDELVDQDA